MTSNTCETPPVGSGSAGTNISRRIPTAKLFSAKTEVIAPRVLGESLRSQASSSSLNRPLSIAEALLKRSGSIQRGATGPGWSRSDLRVIRPVRQPS